MISVGEVYTDIGGTTRDYLEGVPLMHGEKLEVTWPDGDVSHHEVALKLFLKGEVEYLQAWIYVVADKVFSSHHLMNLNQEGVTFKRVA